MDDTADIRQFAWILCKDMWAMLSCTSHDSFLTDLQHCNQKHGFIMVYVSNGLGDNHFEGMQAHRHKSAIICCSAVLGFEQTNQVRTDQHWP